MIPAHGLTRGPVGMKIRNHPENRQNITEINLLLSRIPEKILILPLEYTAMYRQPKLKTKDLYLSSLIKLRRQIRKKDLWQISHQSLQGE